MYVTHDQIEAMTLADRVVVMNRGAVQQVGPPQEIYDNPANTFVAGFIGSPAMNLLDGEIEGGTFRAEGVEIDGLPHGVRGPVTLGYRAEDASLGGEADSGGIAAPVYSVELLGDATMITVRVAGGALVALRVGKDHRAAIGEPVRFIVPPAICHLFDRETGKRLAA